MEPGTTLLCADPGAGSTTGGYNYFYGKFTAIGTDAKHITIVKPYRIYLWNKTYLQDGTWGQCHLEYVDILNPRYQWAPALDLRTFGDWRNSSSLQIFSK